MKNFSLKSDYIPVWVSVCAAIVSVCMYHFRMDGAGALMAFALISQLEITYTSYRSKSDWNELSPAMEQLANNPPGGTKQEVQKLDAITVITGEGACGKSTLVRAMAAAETNFVVVNLSQKQRDSGNKGIWPIFPNTVTIIDGDCEEEGLRNTIAIAKKYYQDNPYDSRSRLIITSQTPLDIPGITEIKLSRNNLKAATA